MSAPGSPRAFRVARWISSASTDRRSGAERLGAGNDGPCSSQHIHAALARDTMAVAPPRAQSIKRRYPMSEKARLDIPVILPGVADADDPCVSRLTALLTGRPGIETAHVRTGEGVEVLQIGRASCRDRGCQY